MNCAIFGYAVPITQCCTIPVSQILRETGFGVQPQGCCLRSALVKQPITAVSVLATPPPDVPRYTNSVVPDRCVQAWKFVSPKRLYVVAAVKAEVRLKQKY